MAARLNLVTDGKGATAIEYALIAALIAMAAVYGMQGLGSRVLGMYNNIAAAISG